MGTEAPSEDCISGKNVNLEPGTLTFLPGRNRESFFFLFHLNWKLKSCFEFRLEGDTQDLKVPVDDFRWTVECVKLDRKTSPRELDSIKWDGEWI